MRHPSERRGAHAATWREVAALHASPRARRARRDVARRGHDAGVSRVRVRERRVLASVWRALRDGTPLRGRRACRLDLDRREAAPDDRARRGLARGRHTSSSRTTRRRARSRRRRARVPREPRRASRGRLRRPRRSARRRRSTRPSTSLRPLTAPPPARGARRRARSSADHPNWALVPSRRARAFDDRDRIRHGRSPGARWASSSLLLQCVFDAGGVPSTSPSSRASSALETYERLAGRRREAAQRRHRRWGGVESTRYRRKVQRGAVRVRARGGAALAFPRALLPGTTPSAIEREVPAFGASLAAQAAEILSTGTRARWKRSGAAASFGTATGGRARATLERRRSREDSADSARSSGRLQTPSSAARLPKSAAASARPASASCASCTALNNPAPAGARRSRVCPGTLDRAAAPSSLRALPGFGRVAVARLALAGSTPRTKPATRAAPPRPPSSPRRRYTRSSATRCSRSPSRGRTSRRCARRWKPRSARSRYARRRSRTRRARRWRRGGALVPAATRPARELVPGGDSSSEGELPGGDSDDSSRRSGWRVVPVGGARRSRASHDADFVIAHPSLRTAEALRDSGAFAALVSGLDATGRLARAPGAFRRTHEYPPGAFAERARALDAELDGARQGNLDLHSKLFGLFLCGGGGSAAASRLLGRYRRLDAVVVPFAQLPFATVGWTGPSRQPAPAAPRVAARSRASPRTRSSVAGTGGGSGRSPTTRR